jgi:hypothetical protein
MRRGVRLDADAYEVYGADALGVDGDGPSVSGRWSPDVVSRSSLPPGCRLSECWETR